MYKIIIAIIIGLGLYGFVKMDAYLSKRIYDDCMSAGKYSAETCLYYSKM